MSDWLDDAESILKTAMGAFDRLQAQKRIEEQAALERAAAAERARLEEEAAAATAKASADAEVLLKQADEAKQSGDAETAARLESQASTRVEQGAFTAQVLEQTSSLMSAPTSQVSTPKVRGVSKREVWKFEITDPALVPREYLVIDESKIRGVVQALKGATTIPGVRAYPDSQIAARAA
jgi:colicin import membrane protein